MELTTIRAWLQDALEEIDGLRAVDYAPDQISPPLAVVGGPTIDFDLVMARGADVYEFPIFLFVSRASDRAAHLQLDAFIPAVKEAVEGHAAGSTGVHEATVRTMQSYGVLEVNAQAFLGCTFTVEVVANG